MEAGATLGWIDHLRPPDMSFGWRLILLLRNAGSSIHTNQVLIPAPLIHAVPATVGPDSGIELAEPRFHLR
jgi:hypothetical protein